MTKADMTILDTLFSEHSFACQRQPVTVTTDELTHVFGTQEPVRNYPDDRASFLLKCGWLRVEHINPALALDDRPTLIAAIQQQARARIKQGPALPDNERQQVRWLWEKTRTHESAQQITQRVWLAVVLYNLGFRGLTFDAEGQILYEGGMTARVGHAPDLALDLVWNSASPALYVASFRQADGVVVRSKGRQRWHIYCLTLDPAARVLFERRLRVAKEKVALIVASDIHATQPQLPRDFYGGNAFQQACIDAQDQHFAHILVLSPQHGILSLDDTVPSEQSWAEMVKQSLWFWQLTAIRCLGQYLYGPLPPNVPHAKEMDWWAWLNPESVYEFTVFGEGFPVRILLEQIVRAHIQMPDSVPLVVLAEQRPGYDVGDLGYDWFGGEEGDYEDYDSEFDGEEHVPDFFDYQQLMDWAGEFVERVNIYVLPTDELWELTPDDGLLPMRFLEQEGVDVESLLDLLTDITLLLEQPLPLTMLVNASTVVSVLLQVSHNLVHKELDAIHETISAFPEPLLGQYVEKVLQEKKLEDQLCACLSLAEHLHLMAQTITQPVTAQLLVWLQTYISGRIRQQAGDRAAGPGKSPA